MIEFVRIWAVWWRGEELSVVVQQSVRQQVIAVNRHVRRVRTDSTCEWLSHLLAVTVDWLLQLLLQLLLLSLSLLLLLLLLL